MHKRIFKLKNFSRPKFTWHCNGTLTILCLSFLFCFCQVHRFSTKHWFRWMRNSRLQLHKIGGCARMNYKFILFNVIRRIDSSWNKMCLILRFRCLFMRAAWVCLGFMLLHVASHCAISLLIGDVLTPLVLLHTSTDVWRPGRRSKRKRFATQNWIISLKYFCFTTISLTISQARLFRAFGSKKYKFLLHFHETD